MKTTMHTQCELAPLFSPLACWTLLATTMRWPTKEAERVATIVACVCAKSLGKGWWVRCARAVMAWEGGGKRYKASQT